MWTGSGGHPDPEGFYKVLGVKPDANIEEIKRKYKALAIKWHPDKNPTNAAQATEMFQKISRAYETLSDPQKRAEYDSNGYYEDVTSGSDAGYFSHGDFGGFHFGRSYFEAGWDFDDVMNNAFSFPRMFGMGGMGFDPFEGFGNFDMPMQWSSSVSSSTFRGGRSRRDSTGNRRSAGMFSASTSITTTERVLPDGSIEVTTTEESVDQNGTRKTKTVKEVRAPGNQHRNPMLSQNSRTRNGGSSTIASKRRPM
ncbi:hypothetical protein protein [Babesia ovis]|uniref:J domain-containing protein n=1 Tax=Babesia ovis TaxID=5869 RepID=A0A9W5WUT0_BABOV|nr:hypothetical protein protein [Babesia ovis]